MKFLNLKGQAILLFACLLLLAFSTQAQVSGTTSSPIKSVQDKDALKTTYADRLAEYNAIDAQINGEALQTFYCVEDNLGFTWQVIYLGGLIDSALFAGICTDCDDLWFMTGVYESFTSGVVLNYTRVDSADCPDEQTWFITGLADGAGSIFGLAFGCSFFPSVYSADISGGFCGLGFPRLEDALLGNGFTAYPNPASAGFVKLQFNLPEQVNNAQLMVFNSAGQLIETLLYNGSIEQGSHTFDWNTSDVAAGSYHAVLLADGQRFSRLLMVE